MVTAIGLPVISNDNLLSRIPNRSRLPGDRVHTSHGNRRPSNQNKTVKRVQGKGFAIMNEIEVNNHITIKLIPSRLVARSDFFDVLDNILYLIF